jgi:hypothetical protein
MARTNVSVKNAGNARPSARVTGPKSAQGFFQSRLITISESHPPVKHTLAAMA